MLGAGRQSRDLSWPLTWNPPQKKILRSTVCGDLTHSLGVTATALVVLCRPPYVAIAVRIR